VTIVIVNFNGISDLLGCLNSIQKVSYPNLEVIVGDNASTDGSPELVTRKFGDSIKLIVFKKNYGYTGAFNRILKNIQSDYVLIINNDTCLTQNSIRILVDYAERSPDVAIIQPKILALYDPGSFEYAGAAGGYLDKLGYPYCRGRLLFHVEKDK
jgi:GT2 family glycosyltransferase